MLVCVAAAGTSQESAPAHPEPAPDRPRGQHHTHGAGVQEPGQCQGRAFQVRPPFNPSFTWSM